MLRKIISMMVIAAGLASFLSSCEKEKEEPLATVSPKFTYLADNNGFAPASVSFTNQSVNAVTYSWDFGDNKGTSTEENPSYAYSEPGNYQVTLTAYNPESQNLEASVTNTVVVKDPATDLQSKVFFHNGDTYKIESMPILDNASGILPESLDALSSMDYPVTMSVDYANKKLYFAHVGENEGFIGRCDFDGSNEEILLTADNAYDYIYHPYGMTVAGDKIYWADPVLGICRANLDGSEPEFILSTDAGVIEPLALAYDSANNRLYFQNDGYYATGGIYYLDLNNIGAPVQVGGDVPSNLDATALAIDNTNGKIYYAEYAGYVKSVDLDGSGIATISGELGDKASWGLAVDEVNSKVYWVVKWADGDNGPVAGYLMRSDLDGLNKETYNTNDTFYPNGIAVYAIEE